MQKNGSHRNVTLHGIMSNVYDPKKCFWFALTENRNWFLKRNVIYDSKFSPSSVFTLDSIFSSYTHSEIINYQLTIWFCLSFISAQTNDSHAMQCFISLQNFNQFYTRSVSGVSWLQNYFFLNCNRSSSSITPLTLD